MEAALAQAADDINQSRSIEETLDAIVQATRNSLPAFDHVSISERRSDGIVETRAGTDQLPWDLDAVQYEHRTGPCLETIENQEPVVVVENLRHEQRWPEYIPSAIERGVRSQVAVRLFARDRHVAGLNLYNTRTDEVDQDWIDTARLFATHAAIALGHAQDEHHLNQALASRKTIGQAIGIIMERYQIDQDRALQFLMRASSTSNIKLRDIADDIVTTSNERHRRGSAQT